MGKAWDGADIEKHAANKERGGVMADGKTRQPRDLPAESAGTYDTSTKGNVAFQIFTENWAKEAFRVLKPGGHMLVFCGPRTYHRMASGVEDAGFEIRDQLQWLFGSGFPKSHNLKGDHEGWGTALKPASRFFYCAKASKSERNKGLENEAKTKEGNRPGSPDPTGKFPDHDHRTAGANNHPTVKPVKLMGYLIKLITREGGVVLDPFCGSGTTGVAAKANGFNFIGIEMSPEYCEIARKRIEY